MRRVDLGGPGIDRRGLLRWGMGIATVAALPSVLSGCASKSSGGGASSGPRIGFTHPAAQAGIVAAIAAYAAREVKSRGGSLTIGALANATPEAQYNLIDGWITQGYDAVEVFPLDPVSLAPLRQKAQAKGIKWVSYLASMEGQDGIVGPEPDQQGTQLKDGFLKWVNETGYGQKALVLDFAPIPSTNPRVTVAAEACRAQTDIEIVSTQDSVDSATAQQITENTMRAHPDLDVVLCLTDDAAMGALTAFKNAGKDPQKCFIGGCDGTKDALEALLADTAYKASAAFDLKAMAEDMARVPFALLDGKPAGDRVQATLLTPADRAAVTAHLARFKDI